MSFLFIHCWYSICNFALFPSLIMLLALYVKSTIRLYIYFLLIATICLNRSTTLVKGIHTRSFTTALIGSAFIRVLQVLLVCSSTIYKAIIKQSIYWFIYPNGTLLLPIARFLIIAMFKPILCILHVTLLQNINLVFGFGATTWLQICLELILWHLVLHIVLAANIMNSLKGPTSRRVKLFMLCIIPCKASLDWRGQLWWLWPYIYVEFTARMLARTPSLSFTTKKGFLLYNFRVYMGTYTRAWKLVPLIFLETIYL